MGLDKEKKIGRGIGPKEADPSLYYRDIRSKIEKFNKALISYPFAEPEEKQRLKGVMDEQLNVLEADMAELKRRGLHKYNGDLRKNYKVYIETESPESYAAAVHDLSTFQEFFIS